MKSWVHTNQLLKHVVVSLIIKYEDVFSLSCEGHVIGVCVKLGWFCQIKEKTEKQLEGENRFWTQDSCGWLGAVDWALLMMCEAHYWTVWTTKSLGKRSTDSPVLFCKSTARSHPTPYRRYRASCGESTCWFGKLVQQSPREQLLRTRSRGTAYITLIRGLRRKEAGPS